MRRTSLSPGYTLIEMLVAIIIFAIITTATAFALTTAVRARENAESTAEDMQEASAIIHLLRHDLRSAIASGSNRATYFVGQNSGSGDLLSFSTLAPRLAESSLNEDADSEVTAGPQSDIALVAYRFEAASRSLFRLSTSAPSTEALEASPGAALPISSRVLNIEVSFADPEQGSKDEWQFTNEEPPAGEASAAAGGGADTGQQAAEGDTKLPASVSIHLELVGRDGRVKTYSTTIAMASAELQPAGQTPPTPNTGGQPTGSMGSGGGGGGAGAGGGSGGGGGGARRPLSSLRSLPGFSR